MNRARQKPAQPQDNLFRLLCDNLTAGIVLLDGQGEVEYLNPSLKKLFAPDINHWSDLQAFMIAMCKKAFPGDSELGGKISRISGFMKAGESGEIHEETVTVHERGGGRPCVTIRVTLLKDRECLIIFQDTVSENPGDCALMEKWQSEDTVRVLRKIAHDSNNLLGAVTGYAELALGDLPDREDPVRHFIQQILKGSTRARDLMQQIDALTLLENGEKTGSSETTVKV